MKNKPQKLEHVPALKIEVSDLGNALMNTLEIVLNPWLEGGCDLNADGIELLTLANHGNILDKRLKKNWPLVYLYPKRESVIRPIHGFQHTASLFNGEFKTLTTEQKKTVVVKKIKEIIFSHNFLYEQRSKYDKKSPCFHLERGDCLEDSFTIQFETNFYYSHFCISMSRYHIPT